MYEKIGYILLFLLIYISYAGSTKKIAENHETQKAKATTTR